jgi:riboflavin kinase/FMN adenylyltransferase
MIAVRELDQAASARSELEVIQGDRGPAAATVGFFDGLHRGHQRILAELSGWAREGGGAPAIITFDRHPQEVLRHRPPVIITPLEHRLVLLARSGVELALVLKFDLEIASWSPEEFIRRVLVEALGARRLLLGFDSALGKNRRGTFEYLKAREEELGISVRRAEPLLLDGQRVSSTLVREAALAGDLRRLEGLLGRPFSILGMVTRGAGRGRGLGFPTANLALAGQALPPPGVYFADAEPLDLPAEPGPLVRIDPGPGRRIPSVVNLGRRPTFGGDAELFLEAHLLDFEGDLYGRSLELHFLERRRDEMRFGSVKELVAQIRRDVEARRDYRRR